MTRILEVALSAAMLLGAVASGAHAYPALPNLPNLDFTQFSGAAPKNGFTTVNPVGWTGGNGLIYIDAPTPGAQATDGNGGIPTYGNPVGSVPGNYVEADGNPDFESGFNYMVTGLKPGHTYTLSFYQGASTELGFTSTTGTTNQWIVGLGGSGFQVCYNCGPVSPVFGTEFDVLRCGRRYRDVAADDGPQRRNRRMAVCLGQPQGHVQQ